MKELKPMGTEFIHAVEVKVSIEIEFHERCKNCGFIHNDTTQLYVNFSKADDEQIKCPKCKECWMCVKERIVVGTQDIITLSREDLKLIINRDRKFKHHQGGYSG